MIWQYYRNLMASYPLAVQMFSTGFLMGAGDLISQFAIEKKTKRSYELTRTLRFFGIGFLYIAPSVRTWYHLLERVQIGGPKLTPLFRVAFDQLLFGPPFLCTVLIMLRVLEGNSVSVAVERCKRDFWEIFVNGLKLWPAVQLVNFYFVPLEYRLLLVQTVALGWNTYIAYATNKPAPPVTIQAKAS